MMPHWIHRLFHNHEVEKQLDAELQFHLEQQIADNLAAGVSPLEASRQAQISIGGVEQVKQRMRDVHWENFLENIWRDFRFAIRSLNRDWRLALTAIFALALGIGVCTVAFSTFYNLLFNAFDTRDISRLVVPMRDELEPLQGSLSDIDAIREQNQVFEDVVGYGRGISLVSDGQETHQLYNAKVTTNAFMFYGVPALLGRAIIAEDGNPGAPPVFVISYDAWKNSYDSDPLVVGKNFTVDGQLRTLIGVMPPRFHGYGAFVGTWIPLTDTHNEANTQEDGQIFARLKPGITLAAASADLDVIVQRLASAHPDRFPNHVSVHLQTATDFLMGPSGIGSAGGPAGGSGVDLRKMLYSLLAAGLALLLIACSNVANLLLARATVREKEIAVRAALGATRRRLIQQLLLESSILSSLACAVGCGFAYLGSKAVSALLPHKGLSIGGEVVIGLDPTVLLFAIGVTILTTLICGLAPALHAIRRDLHPSLSGSGKNSAGNPRHAKLRTGLVLSQIALSIILLVGAGLLFRSFSVTTHVDLGFNPKNVVIAAFGPPPNRTVPIEKDNLDFRQKAVQRIEALPGIAQVAIGGLLPGFNGGHGSQVALPGSTRTLEGGLSTASENLLQTLELRLVRGRWLSRAEVNSALYVAVINQRMAHEVYGDEDPVGQELQVKSFAAKSQEHDAYFRIIGVIADVKNFGPTQPAVPQAFIPYTITGNGIVILKTKSDPAPMMHSIQEQVWALNRDTIFAEFTPATEMLNRFTYSTPKFAVGAVTPIAAIGLLLVIIGLFSVMAYNVALQTHDIGIRLALGAQRGEILRMVLRKGLVLIAVGVVIGVAASYGLTRFIASQLWGVSPTDPWTFVVVIMCILIVGLAACILPARRATQVDPVITLRYE